MKLLQKLSFKTKYMLTAAALAVVAIASVQLTGCATKNPIAGQTIVTTNPATGVSTTNVAPEYLPNTTVAGLVNSVGAVAPLVPAPYGTILTGLLAITTAVAGGIATWKNNQANGLGTQLASVIQGVEAATTDAAGNNVAAVSGSAVKASIQSHATAAGVQPALAAAVQKITG